MGGSMGSVIVDLSISMDGFIAGININPQQPMGAWGLRLHAWFFNPTNEIDKNMMAEVAESSGAVVLGRRMYDSAIDEGWGGVSPFKVHAYVVTSRPAPEKRVDGFTFITDGTGSALIHARGSAGDKNVWLIGGAHLIQQYMAEGHVDELRLHLVPVLLGEGTRLFEHTGAKPTELEKLSVIETPSVIHTRFRIVK
jgi:dihydrofolate reductase